jgi:hypothetical protein
MKTATIVLQVIVGLTIVYVVYKLSLALMKQDRLVIDNRQLNPSFETKIIMGYVDTTLIANKVFNTVNPMANNYLHMPNSYNRKGGAQYSYSFWVFIDDVEQAVNKTILMRGDSRQYSAAVFFGKNGDEVLKSINDNQTVELDKVTSARKGATVPVKPDVVPTYPFIAAPCITLGRRYDQVAVLFNTIQWPFNQVIVNPSANDVDTTKRRNAMKLIAHKWALFTFVLEDNVAINDFEDGVIVRFYLNDMLYYTERVPGTLRTNLGQFYLFPEGGVPQMRIGDLTYYNYAIGQERIKAIYEVGPPRFYSADANGKSALGDPLFLSEYNKLDIYNS